MKSLLLFFVKFGAVLSEIVLVPSNTAVIVGEKMDMNCLTINHSAVLKWSFYNSSRITSTIYRKGSSDRLRGQFAHFGIEINANGPVKLSTNSTRSSDAGIYTCHCEIDGKDAEYSAHLIVIESLPVCESNLTKNYNLIDGDHIWIQCNINFRGFWAPSMEWIQHRGDFGPEGKGVTDGIETMHSSRGSIKSKLTIAVNSSTNGSYYSCKIYFANYSNTEVTTADNVPSFTYTWNSSVIYASQPSPSSTQSVFAVTSSTTEKSCCVDGWLTAVNSCIFVLSICVAIVTISICIVNKRRFKSGSTEKAEEQKADSNPDDYQNAITNENPTIEGSQAATYMELTSLTQASQSVYTSIDIAGRKLAISSDPSPVYEDMADA